MKDIIFKKWGLLPGQIVTEYDHQVLLAIGKQCKLNSPIEARRWVEPPTIGPFEPVKMAVYRLLRIGIIRPHRKKYWKVQPTETDMEIIMAAQAMRVFMRHQRWHQSIVP